ncbi:hypothetical protein B566_EDAN009161 [Ephemera danica]|nr:hypothetical protein B566_EDAN009161 [Ephemera danica]
MAHACFLLVALVAVLAATAQARHAVRDRHVLDPHVQQGTHLIPLYILIPVRPPPEEKKSEPLRATAPPEPSTTTTVKPRKPKPRVKPARSMAIARSISEGAGAVSRSQAEARHGGQ